ncbi:hypothetical protein HBI25_219440 [Parastagonospora nodorum]|nr:hypothetical protein HBI95_146640 [Parastagonospora nodorum]KAH4800317.1 hypothetical protein HBH61_213070 [Parastagonospora nodorum]KAH4906484.1 hypothetical protein HBI80_084430 [Parastagonospora nodorum]KAH5186063.1 hypothetical protein HBH77_172130 [Parastagonospora nodorum]KAH5406935.1 hypothetical protein HBI32_153720 [Parastagonospora nodorum]
MADDDKDAEFAFNLFSDIAPLLALFGDQFARQFASESLTWVDHLLFAMVPLGIITSITGAIRVQGPRIIKSFIGRGRENRALAEFELMSSTSKEVCEVFNGKSVVRVMGKPTIAQILIFPLEYDTLRKRYEKADLQMLTPDTSYGLSKEAATITNNKPINTDNSTDDLSCGIHTLQTAASPEGSRDKLMELRKYQSLSFQIMRSLVARILGKKNTMDEDELDRDKIFESLGPPNLQLGLSTDQFGTGFFKKRHEIFIAAVAAVLLQASLIAVATITVYHERTRRAISFEPKSYGYSCYITGSILLSIGVGVCSLAVERNTVEYDWRLLVQNNAEEESVPRRTPATEGNANIDHSPRLLWLQQSQEVNDQSFGGYTILAGPKYHVITSSRIEDMKPMRGSTDASGQRRRSRDRYGKHINADSYHTKPANRRSHMDLRKWEILAVCGAVTAAAGFIVQFIGLRGLTYPCSIAQLVAILLMTLVRALVRRRLGREPYHCHAIPRFELENLATRIVQCKAFREFRMGSKDQTPFLNDQKPEEILRWRVKTPEARGDHPHLSNTLQDLKHRHASRDRHQFFQRAHNLSNMEESSALFPIEETSSQQLIRVRERLGDLCKWPTEALESARSLVYSVEAFMKEFPPTTRFDSLEWVIETIGLPNACGIQRLDHVVIPVQRTPHSNRWQVDIGTVEAILSLWMASIETKTAAERLSSGNARLGKTYGRTSDLHNWRRMKAGVNLRYDYCRILGDDFEDGSLKRDLSWWVDESIADQSDSHRISNKRRDTSVRAGAPRIPIGSDPTCTQWEYSDARRLADMVIGFNGRSKDSDPRRSSSSRGARELAISSSGLLPDILAQHLFTSFIWTIVDHLPKNVLRQSVLEREQDGDFEGRSNNVLLTGSRSRLRDRTLVKLVRQLQEFGLGNETDILLCVIPAFSFRDLLPNHALLETIPQIRHGKSLVGTANGYIKLLEQSLSIAPYGTTVEGKFWYTLVVAAIDFLFFASEPYDEYIQAPEELRTALQDVVVRLTSNIIAPVIKKLAGAYMLQRRNGEIAAIFKLFSRTAIPEHLIQLFGGGEDLPGCLKALEVPDKKLDYVFFEGSLGFSKSYRAVYEALYNANFKSEIVRPSLSEIEIKEATNRDVFNWTPLHYAAFLEDTEILYRYFDPTHINAHISLHKELGPFGRSPIHMAAISGSSTALRWVSKCLSSTENKRNAYDTVGIDGMSPLHLATKNGHARLVEKIMKKKRLRTTTGVDFWGRAAIHLAASHGHGAITKLLLGNDSQFDAVDEIGKTPLEYLLKVDGELQDNREEEHEDNNDKDKNAEEQSGGKEADHADSNSEYRLKAESETAAAERKALVAQKREIFIEFAKKSLKSPLNRDKSGRTYLHHAIRYTNIETIERLLSIGYKLETKDSVGHTALLFAIWVGQRTVALKLLEGFPNLSGLAASTSVKSERGTTPLMLAAAQGYIDIVRILAERQPLGPREEQETCREDDEAIVQEKPLDMPLTKEDSKEDYGPLARNVNGETALYQALEYGQLEVADYLLHKSDQVQEDPSDGKGNSLLIAAVNNRSVSSLVPSILDRWPHILNQPDALFGQTPLSRACETGLESVVNLLLGIEEVDVNKPASGWGDRTPLHLAVQEAHFTIVQKLLSHSKILVDLRDSNGESAMDKAAQVGDAPILKALLEHHQTSSERRLEFVSSICTSGTYNLQGIVPNILEYIEDATITDEELIQLIDLSEDMRSSVPYKAFVERAFSRDTWKVMDHPYHPVVRIGRSDLVKRLKDYGRETTDLDEDGWSCIEYAKTYCLENVQDDILDLVQLPPTKSGRPQKPERNTTNTLHYPELADSIEVSFCKDHKECPSLYYVTVTKQEDKFTHASIRSEHCTPPLSESTKHFYFEVTVLNESVSKILGLGFCNKRYPTGGMPGWYRSSWGYHGDDGAIFLNNANSDFSYYKTDRPSEDFGAKGEFGANDIIGVGLSLESGKGFVTLNGKLRDVGDMFEGEKFNDRKMYPCVGIDTTDEGVGLRFVINFGESADHPFKFKGPYP